MLHSEETLLTFPTLYESIVGSLLYLTLIRPDIAFVVNSVCQFLTSPIEIHFEVVKRILMYLQGIFHNGIVYYADIITNLTAFSGSD